MCFYDFANSRYELFIDNFLEGKAITDCQIIDYNLLAFACADNVVRVYDIEALAIVKTIRKYDKLELLKIKCLRQDFSVDESGWPLLVVIYSNGEKICWNLETEKIAFKFISLTKTGKFIL